MNIRFISAGAGSGKTFRLTELLNQRLTDKENTARPEAVMATTFTKKAAAELVERVRQKLIEDQEFKLANSMGQAMIGTVNSVCGKLLVRYAFEAGLSPKLEVLTDKEQPVLFGQALDQAMTRDDISEMSLLAQRLGLVQSRQWSKQKRPSSMALWQEQVQKLVEAARSNDIPAKDFKEHAKQSIEELIMFFPAPVDADLDAQLHLAIKQTVKCIADNEDVTKTTKTYLNLLKSKNHRMNQGRLNWDEWVKLSNSKPAKKSEACAEPVIEIASRYEQHKELHTDIKNWINRLFDIAERALTTYQSMKVERGLMDYIDQEHEVLKLLRLPSVADSISQELDLLLVDEFQDTSPIQLALFLKLAALAKECIWVGDIKQAIYGFRGADPELMNAVVNELNRAGHPIDILSSSWRSRPPLVKLINAVFVPAFSEYLKKEQVTLEPERKELLKMPPLRFWSLEGSNIGTRSAELAEGIADLLRCDNQVIDKETKQPRTMKAGDIAVLCGTWSNADNYATALNALGITVALEQAGLLSCPEIHLTLACLRRLVDPQDILASAEIIALKTTQSPEVWLENRLEYLAEENKSQSWGIEGTLQEPALIALEAMRPRLEFLTPSEVLDEALFAGDVRRDAKAWGPTKNRCSQRLENVETLRGLCSDYENYCEGQRLSATVSGYILWLYDLADAGLDKNSVDSQMDAVHILTHHSAKGLEWPVVISADLESAIRGGVWGLSVLSADTFDINSPLANRQLRYWPWPFGGMSKDIRVAEIINNSDIAKNEMTKQIRETVRLLYVSFTRARDYLILPLQTKAKVRPWLDSLGAEWLTPQEGELVLPDGQVVPCFSQVFDTSQELIPVQPDPQQTWFSPPKIRTSKVTSNVSPSMQPAVDSAEIGKRLDVGERLQLKGSVDTEILGKALHNIFAADIIEPNHADRIAMATGALENHGLSGTVVADDVLSCSSRFQQLLKKTFNPIKVLTECPVTMMLDNGQRLNGWIDVLIETEEGWIIVDHKSYPGSRKEWNKKALSYSGQLESYSKAIFEATGQPVISQWIHFSVGGGMVEVVF